MGVWGWLTPIHPYSRTPTLPHSHTPTPAEKEDERKAIALETGMLTSEWRRPLWTAHGAVERCRGWTLTASFGAIAVGQEPRAGAQAESALCATGVGLPTWFR